MNRTSKWFPLSFEGFFEAGDVSPLNSADEMNAFREWMVSIEERLKALEDDEPLET